MFQKGGMGAYEMGYRTFPLVLISTPLSMSLHEGNGRLNMFIRVTTVCTHCGNTA
jgi:hypothetical protein